MDDAEVPASDRVLILTPTAYTLLKQSKATFDNQDIGAELRKKGVIAQLDGLNVVKIASNRLPEKFGFMIAHPVATVAPVKLAEYKIHLDPPFLSGSLVLCSGKQEQGYLFSGNRLIWHHLGAWGNLCALFVSR